MRRWRAHGRATPATVAVVAAFGMNGLCVAVWLSRTPAVRDALVLSPAGLGLLLVCLSGGACLALPLAGPVVHRWGAARTVLAGAALAGVGLAGLAAGVGFGVRWPAAVGLLCAGVGISAWDVAMNVAGAEVERALGRALMPRLHAAFSLGTVAGAGVGALTAALGIPLPAQVLAAAVLGPATMAVAVRSFPVDRPLPEQTGAAAARGRVRSAWREPRSWVIGLLTLSFAFTEGTANDWLAVAVVDGHHGDAVLGAVGFGAFVAAMTLARLIGGGLLDRFGRAPVLRSGAGLALLGVGVVVAAPGPAWALAGAGLWGAGAALGFPVGMSAAADDPARAAPRVGMVSSIAYTAFLAGPPLVGFLAEHVGILRALLVVAAALGVAMATAGGVRPAPCLTARPPDRGRQCPTRSAGCAP